MFQPTCHQAAQLPALFAMALAACGQQGVADTAGAPAVGSAPPCPHARPADVAALVGFAIELTDPLPFDPTPACDWNEKGGDGLVSITVVDARHFAAPYAAPGFARISGLGEEAFVVHELGAWKAGARVAGHAVFAEVDGPTESADTALALLRHVIDRLEGSSP